MADDANSPCAPLVNCENLAGTVLVRRTIYGPSLIDDPRPLAFGEFALNGGAIRAYIDLIYETRWVPKGLCRGPVSSVMSLAPTESVTTGVRTEHRESFTQMMTDSAESSSVQTHTRHQLTESSGQVASGGSSGGIGGVIGGVAGAIGDVLGGVKKAIGGAAGSVFGVEKDLAGAVLDLSPIFAGKLGSFLEDLGSVAGDFAGAVVGAPVALAGAAAGAVSGLVNGAISAVGGGGHGPALVDTQQRIDEITESMEHRESQSHVRQVVVSSSTTTEEFVTRTFSNPYRDRSMQLRFMPVYRHFEVVTTIRSGIPGLAMVAGKLSQALQNVRQSFLSQSFAAAAPPAPNPSAASSPSRLVSTATLTRIALGSAQVNHDDQDVRRPMAELLARNSNSAEREKGVRLEDGLRWSAAQTRDNILHVPVADAETATKAWHLNDQAARQFGEAISILGKDKLVQFAPKITTRQIHLFAGTHVEAVPGDCVLPDILTDALKQSENP